jgi:hypothetical protein
MWAAQYRGAAFGAMLLVYILAVMLGRWKTTSYTVQLGTLRPSSEAGYLNRPWYILCLGFVPAGAIAEDTIQGGSGLTLHLCYAAGALFFITALLECFRKLRI